MKLKFIYLNNPPVNALSAKVRLNILKQLEDAENDDQVGGIVLQGKGVLFCAGADITEFDNGAFSEEPVIHQLIKRLARCKKPTVAAIHGVALGGGLELALGCHYRVAMKTAKFGLPEVNLGLLPAGGGTQLLPRLIGLDNAMTVLVSGKNMGTVEALSLGLIDGVIEDEDELITLCKNICRESVGKRKLCLLDRRVKDSAHAQEIYERHLERVKHKRRGAEAPVECLKLAIKSCGWRFDKGCEEEAKVFMKLCVGDQSLAQRYIFFAQRALKKWQTPDGINNEVQTSNIEKVAVIGLGTMGATIAVCFLQIGIPVCVMDSNEAKTNQGIEYIKSFIADMLSKNVIDQEKFNTMNSLIEKCTTYKQLKEVDLAIEAVFESMELKKRVFRQLDTYCKPGAILATNTSTLNIDEIASSTKRPELVVGMHFFAPAHRMKLLENVRGKLTSAKTISTAMDMGFSLGKTTILVGNCQGFAINRMYANFLMESEFLLEEGAYPEQIDSVLRKYGFPMGRFEVTDVAGNDVGYRVRETQGLLRKQQPRGSDDRTRNGNRYCPLTEIIVEAGRNGYKSGLRGWFQYDAPFQPPKVDPIVNKLIEEYRRKHNIVPRKITDQEILDRMLLSMVNEGFKILHERIASSPMDLDLGWIGGMGWPSHTGGPMFYASTIGLPKVLDVIMKRWEMSKGTEPHWNPSPMLTNLVHAHGNPDIHSWIELSAEQDIVAEAKKYIKFINRYSNSYRKRKYDTTNYDKLTASKIDKIAVIGADEPGCTIAVCCTSLGVPVTLFDASSQRLNRGMDRVNYLLEVMESAEHGEHKRKSETGRGESSNSSANTTSPTSIKRYPSRKVTPSEDFAKLQESDLIIESVDDTTDAKQQVCNQISRFSKSSAIIATSTKLLSIDSISKMTSKPQQVIGMNFCLPAHKIPFLETIRGNATSPQTVVTAMDIGLRMGKATVLVQDSPGFMLDRMFEILLLESEFLLEEGAYPEDIDAVLKDFGFSLGRFEITDAIGNDTGYKSKPTESNQSIVYVRCLDHPSMKQSTEKPPTKKRKVIRVRSAHLTDELIKTGRFGYKSDFLGWYKYRIDKQKQLVAESDERVHEMIDIYRKEWGIKIRIIDDREIFDRVIFSVINEGFKVLEEKVAFSPHDIDIAWLNALFWPKRFGGPMYFANNFGLSETLGKIESRWWLVGESEPHWKPSKLLQDLVNVHNCPDITQWTNFLTSTSEPVLPKIDK